MPIDTSIYGNIREVEAPDMLGMAQKGLSLKSLSMQQARESQQMDAESKENQYKDHLRKASMFGESLDSLAGLKPQERMAAWPQERARLLQSGIIKPEDAPEEHDEGLFRQNLTRWHQSKEHLDKELQRAQIANTQASATKTKQEKDKEQRIPANQLLGINEGTNSLKLVDDLDAVVTNNSDIIGPVAGRIAGLNPWGKNADRAQTLDAQMGSAAQKVGTYLEGGKLAEGDISRYRAMLPQAGDTPQVAKNKLALIKKLISDKQTSDLATLKASGYKTDGFQAPSSVALPETLTAKRESGSGVAHAGDGETKVVNGRTYVKVKGGWKGL
jgi:hypothetical protein